MFRLEFDGLFRTADEDQFATAGILCYGWRVLRENQVIAQGHGTFTRGRNANSNMAEYLALVDGLEALLDMGAKDEPILVCGDAKSVINQMQGIAGVSSLAVKPLYQRARHLADQFNHIHWEWLPRNRNRAADALSRHALKRLRYDPALYETILDGIRMATNTRLANRLVDLGGLRVYHPA